MVIPLISGTSGAHLPLKPAFDCSCDDYLRISCSLGITPAQRRRRHRSHRPFEAHSAAAALRGRPAFLFASTGASETVSSVSATFAEALVCPFRLLPSPRESAS